MARFEINVPDDLESGVYANAVGVWHTAHEFTLDFLTLRPSSTPDTIPARVVSRVKMAPTVIFDLMRVLNENMAQYEATFGPIRLIEQQGPPVPDNGEGA